MKLGKKKVSINQEVYGDYRSPSQPETVALAAKAKRSDFGFVILEFGLRVF
jgi:hypothetical protein